MNPQLAHILGYSILILIWFVIGFGGSWYIGNDLKERLQLILVWCSITMFVCLIGLAASLINY